MNLDEKNALRVEQEKLFLGGSAKTPQYQTSQGSATFAIDGMTCGACVSAITTGLESLHGVSSASVSLVTERGQVEFDSSAVSTSEIKERIEDCGFDAKLLSETLPPPPPTGPSSSNSDNNAQSFSKASATFAIEGMTCGACVSAITSSLDSLSGVSSASVSLVTERGQVEFDPSTISSAEIKEHIEDCGFDARLLSESVPTAPSPASPQKQTAIFSIAGMTCGACVSAITNNLESLDGVSSISISLVTERGSVEFNPTKTSTDKIIETVEDSGFDATLISSDDSAALTNHATSDQPEKTLRLKVYGMTSSVCSSKVESAIRSLDGVKDAVVNLTTEDALIYYFSSIVGPRKIVGAIHDAGYDAILASTADNALQLESLSKIKSINRSRRDFLISAALGVPVFILARFVPSLFPFLAFLKHNTPLKGLYWDDIICLILVIPIQFYVGGRFYKSAAKAIRHKAPTMDVLVCLSITCAFFFSCLSIIYAIFTKSEKRPPTLWETPAMIVTFIVGGKYLENKAKGQTSVALSRLISLSPSTATIYTSPENYAKATKETSSESNVDDVNTLLETQCIPTELIEAGDIVVVLPGEKVPADGTIIRGETYVDESMITGESLSVSKVPGDDVICGSINGFGRVDVKVNFCGSETRLSHIVQLVQNAQTTKTSIQRYADYISGYFVPVVILLGFSTFFVWMILSHVLHRPPHIFNGEEGKFMVCLRLCISVIVVACPCALGLATPTAVMVGTGVGASNGILIKGGAVLETANSVTTVLFDKTGTLTTGDMNVQSFDISEEAAKKFNLSQSTWWKYIGCIEQSSEHPIARGVMKKVREICMLEEHVHVDGVVSDFIVKVGLGVSANIKLPSVAETRSVNVGNIRMMDAAGISGIPDRARELEKHARGETVIIVSLDQVYTGYICVSDTVRKNARETVYALKKLGLSVGLVSGDHPSVARKVASEVGIPAQLVWGGVSPEGKLEIIDQLQSKDPESTAGSINIGGAGNQIVAMVGDGINDSPALARATLGISMAGATDIAMDAADIALLKENSLLDVAATFDLCNVIFNRIRLNLLWAVVYNAIMIPIAMGCFLPLGLAMHPVFAGAAMAFSSVSVVCSSLLLQRWKRPKWMRELYVSTSTDMTTTGNSSGDNSSFQAAQTAGAINAEKPSLFQRFKGLFIKSVASSQHQYTLLSH